jgi:O-antigen ligase
MSGKAETARPNKLSAVIFFAVIAGAPFPFGSSHHVAVAFWCGLLGLGLLAASPRTLNKGQKLLLGGIGIIIAAYAFVLHEQLSDMPWIASFHPIWRQASEVLRIPIKPSVSIVRGEPWYALGAPLALILALTCGVIVGQDRNRASQVLQVIAWSGSAYAIYGIFALVFEPTMILWREKTAYLGSLTSTFINRNTAAAYFGSCTAVWLLLLLQRIRTRLPKRIVWSKIPENILSDADKSVLVRFSMFFLCLTAMFMTGSRGGVIVSLLGLIIAFVAFFRRDLPRGKMILVATTGATGAFALFLLQFLGGNVERRFDVGGLSDAGRLAIYRSTLGMISDHPWFGTGLGTFAWAMPTYRSGEGSMIGIIDIAHSTPLELAAELGIPLTVVVIIAWLVAFAILISGIRRGRRRDILPLAALIVCLIAQLHSMIDFSLQIPGYAIVIFALLGVGLTRSLQTSEAVHKIERSEAKFGKLSQERDLR